MLKFWFLSLYKNLLFFLSDSSAHVSVFKTCPHHLLNATSHIVCTCSNTRGGEAAHEVNITSIIFSRNSYFHWDIKLYWSVFNCGYILKKHEPLTHFKHQLPKQISNLIKQPFPESPFSLASLSLPQVSAETPARTKWDRKQILQTIVLANVFPALWHNELSIHWIPSRPYYLCSEHIIMEPRPVGSPAA